MHSVHARVSGIEYDISDSIDISPSGSYKIEFPGGDLKMRDA